MSGLRLHSTLGVNPRLTVCRRCGGDGDELMLLGSQNTKCECAHCGVVFYGNPDGKARDICPKCGRAANWINRQELTPNERIPAPDYCDKCKAELAEHKQIVAEGGIYWRCKDCGRAGVIRKNEFCDRVRERVKIAAPEPIGVEFSKADCPACRAGQHFSDVAAELKAPAPEQPAESSGG